MESLYKVSKQLINSSSNCISLVDTDPETKKDVVVANLTVYQILQFFAANIQERDLMTTYTLEEMGIGTYKNLHTAYMSTPVIEIVSMFVNNEISVVPIINEYGVLINAFDRSDLPNLSKEGMLDNLDMPVEQAIECRPHDYMGVHTCNKDDNLWSILGTIRKKVVHRLVVIDEDTKPIGVITLNDILKALLV
ncbi:hypothetical protein BB561_004653 [Smittium simulii]|uniref:CBS domain-containing protein n=1 Tax=Smittium simulii TaxID=133385 RepID=A0A2T9YEZ4_9FUNG|nr:hypothetical protein BB561_004653 [Smittium simulii]